jgi:hypothetical protein
MSFHKTPKTGTRQRNSINSVIDLIMMRNRISHSSFGFEAFKDIARLSQALNLGLHDE